MKLESKPKAVKFRIRSGNVEHNSLDSLKKNFVWEDIVPLLDGRLVKWLERLKMSSLAESLNNLESPENHILQVYSILFKTDKDKISSIDEVFAQYPKDKYLISLIRGVAPTLTIKDILRYAKKYDSLIEILIATPLSEVNEDSAAPQYLGRDVYDLAMFLSEKGYDQDVVMKFMTYASSKGVKEATAFITTLSKQDINSSTSNKKSGQLVVTSDSTVNKVMTLTDIVNNHGMHEKISKSWGKLTPIPTQGLDEDDKNLADFSNDCLKLFRLSVNPCNSFKSLTDNSEKFRYCDKKDLLYEEKMFVAALFDRSNDDSIDRLTKISYYPLAKRILESDSNCLFFKDHTYQLNYKRNNAVELRFYVSNLLLFWDLDGNWISKHKENKENQVQGASELLREILMDRKVISCLEGSWINKTPIPLVGNDGVLRCLYEFSNGCLEVATMPYDPYRVKRKVKTLWDNVQSTDPLFFEKKFMQVLFLDSTEGMQILKAILDYPPAKRMYESEPHTFIHGGKTYRLGKLSNNSYIEHFVSNLRKFRDL